MQLGSKLSIPVSKQLSTRLVSIDVLRGLAALGVAAYHVYDEGVFTQQVHARSLFKTIIVFPISYGFVGVYLFFVVSGFCIHLRWVKAMAEGKKDFSVEFIPFWKRRIRRLYPAYLASILLYLCLLGFMGQLTPSAFLVWDVVSHLFLIHNLDPRTLSGISGVFWTLAVEEQLYLAYFLLLWLRRRYGWARTLFICALVRVVWFVVYLILQRRFGVQIVFLGAAGATWCVWALGAYAVEVYYGLVKLPDWARNKLLATSAWLVTFLFHYLEFASAQGNGRLSFSPLGELLLQPMWGIAAFLLLNAIVQLESDKWLQQKRPYAVTLFAWIGLISYSLYLTHGAVIHLANKGHLPRPLTVMLTIGFAYVFFRIFEKPFLKSPQPEPRRELVLEQIAG